MCILFLHTSAVPSRDKFRLILAVNRDETYKRPTLPAHFWMEDPSFIGGRDMEPGKEGGTWLAMSKAGRIASLLNVLSSRELNSAQLLGRGNLVPQYLGSSMTPMEYHAHIANDAHRYSPFNLLAVQISLNDISISASSNASESPKALDIAPGTIGLGNSLLDHPFNKVNAGTERFKRVVRDFGSTATKEALEEELVSLLRWDQQHLPDPEMQRRGSHLPEERLLLLSSVFVKILPTYGTRTHTLILVDADNCVDFIEWTMKEPVNPIEPIWEKSAKHFKLNI